MKLLILFFILFSPCLGLANIDDDDKDTNLPKYEFGVSLIHVYFPKYPGSDENESLSLPVPLFYYRGDIFRVDENGGARGRVISSDRFEINLSLGGAPPASSDKIVAREGMPDLPFILEMGAGLIYKIITPSETHKWSLSFNLPIRVPYAFDGIDTDDRGLVINPLVYGNYKLIPKKLKMFFFASYRWGNKEYNQTYYQVDPEFATASRTSYQAKSGTVASSMGMGFKYTLNGRLSFMGGFSMDDLSNNANKLSPLFRKEHQEIFFAALSWRFFKSDKKQGD